MNLIPHEEFILSTNLSLSNVLERLQSSIQPKVTLKDYYNISSQTKFAGKFDLNGFKVSLILHRERNSFNPIIIGKFVDGNGVTNIKVLLRLHYYVLFFQTIFISISLGFTFIGLEVTNIPFIMVSIGLIIFAYLLMIISFNYAKKRVKKSIIELFQAVIED